MKGTILAGRWRIEGRLGSGGMGEVFRSTDLENDSTVAIKFIAALGEQGDALQGRLAREAEILSRIDHPNVVQVLAPPAVHEGRLFFPLEFVPGKTLAQRLREEGSLDPAEAVRIASAVLDALVAAHAAGIVHRDLKPSNVLLAPDGRVKVADFGLAQATGVTQLTLTGQLMGTAEFMSPEQAEGRPAVPASDLYAVGVILRLMLTGDPPFSAESPMAVLRQQIDSPPPPTGRPAWDRFLAKAFAKDPAARFADAATMAEALPDLLDPDAGPPPDGDPHPTLPSIPGTPPAVPSGARIRHRAWLVPAVLLLLAGTGLGAWKLWSRPETDGSGGIAPPPPPAPPLPAVTLHLDDGAVLSGRLERIDADGIRLQLPDGSTRTIPTAAVRRIVHE